MGAMILATNAVETFVIIECCSCAMRFAVPEQWNAKRRETKAEFFCPNGHRQAYTESEADRLRRERDRLKQDAARLEDELSSERRQREDAERKAKRLQRKAAAAECPCCSRTFGNLRAHMARKHPEFIAEADGGQRTPLMTEGPRS